MGSDITDSSGNKYSIAHLKPLNVIFDIRCAGEPISVDLYVIFSNHCYTGSRKDHHTDEDVLFREKRQYGVDERVFDLERWEFSKRLPGIIKDLHSRLCLQGGSRELFYRQEERPSPSSYEGWYLCIRLSADNTNRRLVLSVRSAHYRRNRPFDVRGAPKRFYAVLAQFYRQEKKKREWL